MEANISYLCKVATFQKEVTYSEWCARNVTTFTLINLHFHLTLCIQVISKCVANSEDLDEMLHNAAFHQGLHYLLRQK